MKKRLEELVQKACLAQPPEALARSAWTPYLPIIRILMEERAYSLTAAVEWLVAQGEIETSRQGMAYRALRQILVRREAKMIRAQAEMHRQLEESRAGRHRAVGRPLKPGATARAAWGSLKAARRTTSTSSDAV